MKKLNIIDWFIIIILILLIFFCFSKLTQNRISKNNTSQIIQEPNSQSELICFSRYLKENTVNEFSNGVSCYNEDMTCLYSINDVVVENYYEFNFDKNNNSVKCVFDDRYNVTFKITVEGIKTKYGFIENDSKSYIGIGSTKYIILNGIKYECKIIGFKLTDSTH